MSYRGFLIFFLLVFLSVSVHAALTDNNVFFLTGDASNKTGTTAFDITTGTKKWNATIFGAPANSSDCMVGECWDFDADSELREQYTTNIDEYYTFCAFVKDYGTGDSLGGTRVTGAHGSIFGHKGSGEVQHYVRDTSGNQDARYSSAVTGWNHLCFVRNGTGVANLYVYRNGSLMSMNVNVNQGANNLLTSGEFSIGKSIDGFCDGCRIDEAGFWSRALTPSEMQALYAMRLNDSNPYTPSGAPPAGTVSVLSYSPNVTSQYNTTPVSFFVEANSTKNMSARLFINGTLNASVGLGNGTNETTISVNLTNGIYAYSWQVNNTDGYQANTTNVTIYFDETAPIVTTTYTSGRVFYRDNLIAQFNLSDNNYLHRANVTVDGTQIAGVMDINATNYQFNITYNTSGLSVGQHLLNLTVADGHTARALRGSYNPLIHPSGEFIQYDLYGRGFVKIQPVNHQPGNTFSTRRSTDRYTFTYTPTTLQQTQEFLIISNLPMRVINAEWTSYKNWLIIGDHWLDFLTPNDPGTTTTYTRISNNIIKATVTGITKREQAYSSLGDLNIISQTYNFTVTNATLTYTTPLVETQSNSIIFNITKTGSITNTSALLFWNGTGQSVTKTSTATQDFYNSTFTLGLFQNKETNTSFSWNYTINTINNTENNLITNTQTIHRMILENCTQGNTTTPTLNYSLRDVDTNALITGNVNADYDLYFTTIASKRDITLPQYENKNSVQACIFPLNTTLKTTATIEAQAPGYLSNILLHNDLPINNTEQYFTIYLQNSSTGTQVIMTVVNEDDSPQENILITIERETTPGNLTLIQSGLTDFQGQKSFNLDVTKQYQINLSKGGVLQSFVGGSPASVGPFTILTSALTFRIITGTGASITPSIEMLGITNNLTFANTSKNFTLTYNDASDVAGQICLLTYNNSVNGNELVGSACSTSDTDTLTFNIGGPNVTGSYTAYAAGVSKTDGNTYRFNSLGISLRGPNIGTEGYAWGIILILTMGIIGLVVTGGNPVGVIVGLLLGIGGANILTLISISWLNYLGLVVIGGIVIYLLDS